MAQETSPSSAWLDHPVFQVFPPLKIETLIAVLILIFTVLTRYYLLGARVMSHDEVNHMVPSYSYFEGRGYRYDPVTHGPLQFHLIAASFFVLGDSDFSARAPYATIGILTVVLVLFGFRPYLGRVGSLAAGLLFAISPFMMFYGRYARNEILIVLWGVAILWSSLRYLETGKLRYIYFFTLANALHFIDKATSYIFAAEIMVFLALFFIERVTRRQWKKPGNMSAFIALFGLAVVFGIVTMGLALVTSKSPADATAAASAATATASTLSSQMVKFVIPGTLLAALGCGAGAIYFLVQGIGWSGIRRERSFDLLVLELTLVTPLLGAAVSKALGFNPLDYSTLGLVRSLGIFIPLVLVAVAIGIWWRPKVWLGCVAMFYAIFIVFFTSFFTNPEGLAGGLFGALGYWMEQQGVARGSQPWYYYVLVQIPMYEFLPALGMLVAVYLGFRKNLWLARPGQPFLPTLEPALAVTDAALPLPDEQNGGPEQTSEWLDEDTLAEAEAWAPFQRDVPALEVEGAALQEINLPEATDLIESAASVEAFELQEAAESLDSNESEDGEELQPSVPALQPVPTLALLIFWSFTSLVAFSLAGEKMPWLTTHIAMPFILAAGWGLGYLVETADWKAIWQKKGLLVAPLVVVFLASLAGLLGTLLGTTPPFQGKELVQLESTSHFLLSLVVILASGAGLVRLLYDWRPADIRRVVALLFFAFLAILTVRASIRASFVNYDTALEYLVYAHAARGPKDALAIMQELSYRITGGKDLTIYYDNDGLYPYWWYLRDDPNAKFYGDKPTGDLRNAPIIVASLANSDASKVDAIVGDAYYKIDYARLWWPNQDYWNLTWDRLKGALTDPQIRAGIFDIWFNRDYTLYAKATKGSTFTLQTWEPSNRMRLYIRKDIAAQIWNFGVAPVTAPVVVDPYAKGHTTLAATFTFGVGGSEPGAFNMPRGLAVAADGSLYVADTYNNRIDHFSPDGKLIQAWGTFADVSKGAAPGGTLNQPWGVAVAPDGSVFVTDTWNHRIQKFTADGQFIKMWGSLGQSDSPDSFYGPRGIAIDAAGHLYIADTGNKRIAIYDKDGNYLAQFGSAGIDPGQFDEPVGVSLDSAGRVYVTDTWNQRVQVFTPDPANPLTFQPSLDWAISGWYGQSLDNKPFLAVDANQHVFVVDPEAGRVLEFDTQGIFIQTWGEVGTGAENIGLGGGIAVAPDGSVWLADPGNNRIMKFVVK